MVQKRIALRSARKLLGPLRALHYRFWRATGAAMLAPLWPELQELRRIVRRSGRALLAPSGASPRILFFTFRSWNTHAVADALLAQAARMRGADVQFFTCGGRLPVCDVTTHQIAPPMPCNTCAPYVNQLLSICRFPIHEMRDFITDEERHDIHRRVAALSDDALAAFEFDGLPIGQLVRPSLYWFLLSGNPPFDRKTRDTYRRFLESGAAMALVAARMLDALKPATVYLLNGLFFAERITIEQARRRGIHFITHEGGFMPDSQVFAHDGFAPYYELDEPLRPLTPDEERVLAAYLDDRAHGRGDVGRYYPELRQADFGGGKRTLALFTNIDWDTAAFAANAAFANMEKWLVATVRAAAAHPDWQLIIRVHPGEVRLPYCEPREGVVSLLARHFPTLPPNVRVVPPESPASSYALMDASDAGLVYTSTTGLEMVLRGKPVITAGAAYYAKKGFTHDARSGAEYEALLAETPPLTDEQRELARRYAYLFFFRHHIPFPLTSTRGGKIGFTFDDLDALRPGRNELLDLAVDGILLGRRFLR